jgi:hypothetical protein
MLSRCMTAAIAALAFGTLVAGNAFAQDTVKIGLVVAMTGAHLLLQSSQGLRSNYRSYC